MLEKFQLEDVADDNLQSGKNRIKNDRTVVDCRNEGGKNEKKNPNKIEEMQIVSANEKKRKNEEENFLQKSCRKKKSFEKSIVPKGAESFAESSIRSVKTEENRNGNNEKSRSEKFSWIREEIFFPNSEKVNRKQKKIRENSERDEQRKRKVFVEREKNEKIEKKRDEKSFRIGAKKREEKENCDEKNRGKKCEKSFRFS